MTDNFHSTIASYLSFLSNPPKYQNRQLTATEVRIGNLMSASPIDVNMKASFKEFRQLLAITSISPDAKFNFSTSVMVPNNARTSASRGGKKSPVSVSLLT